MLAGSRPPQARNEQDLGALSPQTPVPGITLVFKRSAAQEADLQDLLAAQQDTASPLFHHWLTPESFAVRFGMADADLAATRTWLQSLGFHIESVARSRDRITFSGTAAQVQAGFGAELHRYRTAGELHFAPASDLALPAELAPVTAAVLHLSDFRPKPNVAVRSSAHPDYTTAAAQAHYLTPKDLATMYDLNTLNASGFYGEGQGLAVVGQSFVNTSNGSALQTFQSNVTQDTAVQAVLVPNSGVQAISPGDEGESEIDLEYASGIAQNANLYLVYVGDNQNYNVFDSLAFAIDENLAPVMSISYSACEPLLSSSELAENNALFEQASAQGQTIVASSDDSGSTACAPYTVAEGVTVAQQQSLAVAFPADSPLVTAVGGTQMAAGTFSAGSSPYWATASTTDKVSSLLSYVPEIVWNEGSASQGIAAGGGGTSAYFPRPSWQASLPGIPAGAYRLLPDIALQASISDPGFLICTSDSTLLGSEGQSYGCDDGLLGSNDQYTIAGGTSFAAPVFAGAVAILNQIEHATGQGNVDPVLYGLAASPASYAAVFHDITSGSIACVAGAAGCAAPGQSGYAATAGYDEATGLGSLDFGQLVAAWPPSATANGTPTTVLLTAGQYAVASGASLPIQIYVSSVSTPQGSSIPSGNVSVSVDGIVVEPSLALSAAGIDPTDVTASYTLVAPATAGSHLVTVNYPGDATHLPSVATQSVLVGEVAPSGNFALSAGNIAVANDGTGSTTITVTPSGGYSGRVFWSLSASGSGGSLTACYALNSLPVSGTSTTTLTLGVNTACNSPLPAARGAVRSLGTRASVENGTRTPGRSTPVEAVCAGLLLCGLAAGRRRSRRLLPLLCITLLTMIGAGLTGCGSSTQPASTPTGPGTPTAPTSTATAYTLTLVGTDSVNTNISAQTTFTLTVN